MRVVQQLILNSSPRVSYSRDRCKWLLVVVFVVAVAVAAAPECSSGLLYSEATRDRSRTRELAPVASEELCRKISSYVLRILADLDFAPVIPTLAAL